MTKGILDILPLTHYSNKHRRNCFAKQYPKRIQLHQRICSTNTITAEALPNAPSDRSLRFSTSSPGGTENNSVSAARTRLWVRTPSWPVRIGRERAAPTHRYRLPRGSAPSRAARLGGSEPETGSLQGKEKKGRMCTVLEFF
jgi:hypothetical protein